MKKIMTISIILVVATILVITAAIILIGSEKQTPLEVAIKTHCDKRGLNDIYHEVIKQTENSAIVLIVYTGGVENHEFRYTFERLCLWKEDGEWKVVGYREWPNALEIGWWV